MSGLMLTLATIPPIIFTLMSVVLIVVAGLMVFVILLQEGKAGGISALGGATASASMGVSNPMRRATVWLAIIFFIIAIVINVVGKTRDTESEYQTGWDTNNAAAAKTESSSAEDTSVAPVKPDEQTPAAANQPDKTVSLSVTGSTGQSAVKTKTGKPADGSQPDSGAKAGGAVDGAPKNTIDTSANDKHPAGVTPDADKAGAKK